MFDWGTICLKLKSDGLELLYVKHLVLYFFLLILGIFLNLTPNVVYKCDRFSKAFLEKSFKLVPYEKNNSVSLDTSFMLLPAKIDFFSKK